MEVINPRIINKWNKPQVLIVPEHIDSGMSHFKEIDTGKTRVIAVIDCDNFNSVYNHITMLRDTARETRRTEFLLVTIGNETFTLFPSRQAGILGTYIKD